MGDAYSGILENEVWIGLAGRAADCGIGSAREADADEEERKQYSGVSDCGTPQEVDEDVIDTQGEQERTCQCFRGGC
ncbi:MAG: hypothetical protein ABR881_12675 [Candidatus Sulfotelmatobacter sp.]